MNPEIQDIQPKKVTANAPYKHESISMNDLACTSNLKKLEDLITDEYPRIEAKQDSIRVYRQIQNAMDDSTDPNGELDASKFEAIINKMKNDFTAKYSEHLEKIDPAKEKDIARLNAQFNGRIEILDGVATQLAEMKKAGNKISSEQRTRLTRNIANELADLNLQINLDLQKMKKYTDHHHQCHQLARSMAKTYHDILISNAKAAGGR